MKMHEGEPDIDEALVQRLVTVQFPRWADLPVKPVLPWGTDNAIYRLGDDLIVRLPRRSGGLNEIDKNERWLPLVAPHLPLAVPVTLERGRPGEGYPWDWSVARWLEGERATPDKVADSCDAAVGLAQFIKALQSVEVPDDAPQAYRGKPLAPRDALVRESIAALDGLLAADAVPVVTSVWETALAAPDWDRAPVWIHGDITPGNLLVQDGRPSAVIDFGGLGAGDPAAEMIPAWNMFSAKGRAAFRAELGVDDATWERGRGWALSIALVALPYYLDTFPGIVAESWRVIDEVVDEYRAGAR